MKKQLVMLFAGAICSMLTVVSAEAKEVRLALFPFDANASEDLANVQNGIAAMLPGRLSMPGQLDVIEPAAPAQAGQRPRSISASEQLALAKKAGADFLLAGTITKLGQTISIDARLVSVTAGDSTLPIFVQSAGIDAIIPQLNILAQKARNAVLEKASPQPAPAASFAADDSQYPQPGRRSSVSAAPADEPEDVYQPPPRRPQSKPSRFETDRPKRNYGANPAAFFEPSPAFTATITGKPLSSLCSGDVNGDGKKELIAAGPDFVAIYQLNGAALEKIAEIQVGIDEHVVHVDAGDFNGNGIDELYVSCYETENARSFIIEFQQNQFVRIAQKERWFYRVYSLSDASVKLIGQQAGTMSPFSGDIFLMQWKDGKVISREQFILPGSRDIYGFGEGDIDADGATDFLVFERGLFNIQPDLTMVSTTSKTIWRDRSKLGGTPNFFLKYTTGNDMEEQEYVPLRVICADIAPDGRWAAIVGKNYRKGSGVLSKIMDFNEGHVQCLLWDGSDLAPNWTSPSFSGTVRDYIFDDIDKDGIRELLILSSQAQGLMGNCANTVTAYREKKK